MICFRHAANSASTRAPTTTPVAYVCVCASPDTEITAFRGVSQVVFSDQWSIDQSNVVSSSIDTILIENSLFYKTMKIKRNRLFHIHIEENVTISFKHFVTRYIEGLHPDNPNISNWERQLTATKENTPIDKASNLHPHNTCTFNFSLLEY